MNEPVVWTNRSPGDLTVSLPEAHAGNVEESVSRSAKAFPEWKRASLDDRITALKGAQEAVKARQEELAVLIATEMGKPLREARLELGAVIAKFDLTFEDARRYIGEEAVEKGPHPAAVRHRARGPAAVISPFNFPIHLGHGAAMAYLVAGNTVLFKPSPLVATTVAAYAEAMQSALPPGVFELVQGWGAIGQAVCLHPAVRSVCFTGSVPVGKALARDLAEDYSKSVALELGGKNAVIVLRDADLALAAECTADAMCLTTGQRCNATSRVLVAREVEKDFCELLKASLQRYQPGYPLDETTMLGPLATERSVQRYSGFLAERAEWIVPGDVLPQMNGHTGYYVRPAVAKFASGVSDQEMFCPIVSLQTFDGDEELVALHDSVPFGLTASIFTATEESFREIGDRLEVGNLYWNLPTTFSPSTLPFGGFGASGNGKPGGRGFVRFAVDEQAVQWRAAK
jgi:acyl-CoA reductase-like NAD-dependent aldehyde dehydrogenase